MNSAGWLRRAAGAVLGIVLFIAAIVFASVVLAIAAILALLAWLWLWWRTRGLPKRDRRGVVIEGEYRVEPEQPRHLGDGKP